MVEHSPCHAKVEGLNPGATATIEKEKMFTWACIIKLFMATINLVLAQNFVINFPEPSLPQSYLAF